MSQQEDAKNVYPSHVTPRIQWDANFGYCGETSFICAGMSFGQYCSQYTARSLASYGIDQARQGSQLLLGTDNALKAAGEMSLKAIAFDSQVPDSESGDVPDLEQATHKFLTTVKSNLLAGGVPIIGVFNNCDILGEGTARNYGDGQYDHIVPIVSWVSHHPLDQERADQYIADDAIVLSDNGLYTPGDPATPPFLFTYEVGSFQGTREQANNPDGPVYMLKWQPQNFGVVIQGVSDTNGVTIPVSLSSTLNSEPPMQNHSDTAPAPAPMDLTATVTIPDESQAYNVYVYNDFADVPSEGFNAGNPTPYYVIQPNQGSTVQLPVYSTTSDQTVVFRAVPVGSQY
jgi:hypothetical protein